MKRDFLKELGLEGDVIDKIMAEHGRDITAAKADADAQKQTIAAHETEIEGLKAQIAQRDTDIRALQESAATHEAVKQQLSDLQAKYKTDTDALNAKLTEQQTEFVTSRATEKFFSGVKFSSEMAREAVTARFRAKGFKLDGETFQGGTEWLDQFRKDNPDAFAAAEEPDKGKPAFTKSLNNGGENDTGAKTAPNFF